MIAHASAGSVQLRRQNPRPSHAAATAARVNMASWAGNVQYEWSMYVTRESQPCTSRRLPMRSTPLGRQ